MNHNEGDHFLKIIFLEAESEEAVEKDSFFFLSFSPYPVYLLIEKRVEEFFDYIDLKTKCLRYSFEEMN
ncbi:hypothetical protein QW060_06630 [Myroides ceti]|uniref:Maturase K n=1 Tax=Paenimyroides ceti TaxID=395087 RepID=A0ABT8CSS2_9FLAO|nr:hypothetical protein [Paenimyroides ceti]MDN3706806.1 hypothetical protein [Paenimyroides ceti]